MGRVINVAAKVLPEGVELQVWDPAAGELGTVVREGLDGAEEAVRAYLVEEGKAQEGEELSITVYRKPGQREEELMQRLRTAREYMETTDHDEIRTRQIGLRILNGEPPDSWC